MYYIKLFSILYHTVEFFEVVHFGRSSLLVIDNNAFGVGEYFERGMEVGHG